MLQDITTVELFNYILLITAVLAVIYRFIMWVTDPKKKEKQAEEDRQQDIKLALAQQESEYLKKQIEDIKSDIKNIKTNHLAHIEKDLNNVKLDVNSIFTILNERLPK